MRKKIALLLALVLVVCTLAGCGTPTVNNTPAQQNTTTPDNTANTETNTAVEQQGVVPISDLKLPAYISISTYDVGSATFGMVAGVCEGILKTTGITTRQIVGSTDKARLTPVRTGSLDIVAGTSNTTALAGIGRAPFNTSDWGPQQLRQIWSTPSAAGNALYVLKSSGITSFEQLRGKKITWIPGNDSANLAVESCLAYAGLTWDDVEKVNCSNPTDSYNAFAEGRADAYFGSGSSAALQEISQTKEIMMIEPDANNAEAWARVKAINPGMSAGKSSTLVGNEGKECTMFAMCGPVYLTYPNCSDDVAYAFAQALDISYNEFVAYSNDLRNHDRAHAVALNSMVVPFHEGAIKYFKDAGFWTDELQARQDELLAREKKYTDAWEKCLTDFSTSGKKANEFEAYWDEIRDSIK